MRLAALAKCGFYPANGTAINLLLKHLTCRPPNPEKKFDTINILDPCAGKGVAIRDIAAGLEVPEEHVYTVELDSGRSEDCKRLMPGHHHVGPAGFLGVQITGQSFGLVYCNPPFDNELGGGRREEQVFAEASTRKLVPKGILVLVCPLKALAGNRGFVEFLDANYDEIAVYKFPDGEDDDGNLMRPYNEMIVIGRKRGTAIPLHSAQQGKLHGMNFQWSSYVDIYSLPSIGGLQPKRWSDGRSSHDREETIRTWEIPHSWKPHVFKKIAFTEAELEAAIAESPLNRLLEEVEIPPPNAPPLPLDKGHLGLILASGMLDGVVEGPHGVHVVRGSSHKIDYHNKEMSTSEANPETGAVTTKTVLSQRMITVIRVVDQTGEIRTFSNEPKEKDTDEEEYEL